MRPLCVCRQRPAAINYKKNGKTFYRRRCEICLKKGLRHGIPKGATMAQLQKAAKAPGRKGQLARWQINMRRGRKKAK